MTDKCKRKEKKEDSYMFGTSLFKILKVTLLLFYPMKASFQYQF